MNGRYNIQLYVGIDISKLNHFTATISAQSEIPIEPFKSTYDYDGFYLLLPKLSTLDQHTIIICFESTTHYDNNLVCFLTAKDSNMTKSDKESTHLLLPKPL